MKSLRFLFFSTSKFFGILSGLLILVFSFSCQKDGFDSGSALVPGSLSSAQVGAKTNNYLVITKSETLPAGFETKLSAYGKIVRSMPEIGEVVITPSISNFETKVAKLTEVQAVLPDIVVKWIEPVKYVAEAAPQSIGDDEGLFTFQWGMEAIHAPEAWEAGYTGSGTRVFILDTGIDADNPDLNDNLNNTLSKSFIDNENYYVDPGSYFNHGTHVAGIIAAEDNEWGVIGVAPHAEIVAVKVLSEYTGSGAFSVINAGIVYAANNGADVINMSLGATFSRNGYYYDEHNVLQRMSAASAQYLILVQQRAVNYAIRKGATIIVSAGNDGMNADGNASWFVLPGDLENVIAVSATAPYKWFSNRSGSLDIPASYTNYGRSLIDLAAPGGDWDSWYSDPNGYNDYYYDAILSTGAGPDSDDNYYFYYAAGTSMAAPHVAGVAALIIGKNGGSMNPVAVIQKLFRTADKIGGPGVTPYYGYGRVNAYRAVTE